MPRSSRHKSHRSHKHGGDGRDRSDSEDDGNSRKPEPAARASRDADSDKRKSLQPPQAKDPVSGNGDFSGEHGRKRKDRSAAAADESVVVVVDDRWNGGGEDEHVVVDKKAKAEVFRDPGDPDKVDKSAKTKLSAGDSKSRSSRRHEGSSERIEESGSKVESAKLRSEKELSRRESSGSQHKVVKERERDYSKDAKERDKDYGKDAKERDRDYVKDVKEKERDQVNDAKERDRDHTKDAKDRDRGHSKDAKDRDRGHSKDAKERDRDHIKDAKERDRDYSKDAKERDAKERDAKERDRGQYKDAKERDRDYYKEERDRDYYKDAKERDRDNYKDAKERDRDNYRDIKERDRDYSKDAREKERDYSKDTKDRDRDYSKDARERDREYYKDARERERERDYSKDARERDRERGSERDKRVQDARHEMSDDTMIRKQASKINSAEVEHGLKKNVENAGGQIQDGLRNPEPEKELDKHVRRRDSSGDKDKYLGVVKDSDDRRLSSRDDHTKNSSYKDESQREGRYRDRYKDGVDRDQRYRDDRGRDERSSRDHNNRSDNKHFRDENRLPESRFKKSKILDPDHDNSPYADDHGTNLRDNRVRKVFSDESEDHFDLKPHSAKEPHEDLDKNVPSTSKFDPYTGKTRLDYLHADKVDSNMGSRPKSSPSSGNHNMKDQIRYSSKQAGSSCRKSLSEEKVRLSTSSRDHVTLSGTHERDLDSRSLEKNKTKEGGRSGEVEPVAVYYDKTPKSDVRASPNYSTINDRRFSDKIGSRRSFDVEGQRTGSSSSARYGRDNSNPKDRERGLPFEKSIPNDHLRELHDSEPIATGLSSFNRTNHLPGGSPGHLPPPPSVGHGIGSSSVLGSFEDDNRGQIGDRKPNSRYKRTAEHGMGRGQGNAWKSASSWPSPVANGYMHHLQHGPPPGFHPAVQFPTPLFGVRPSMELNHTGISYHLHESADRFSSHGRPFGWHNPVDDCPPPMQVWDGRNGIFGDESHVYGRPEWDMNIQLMNNRGWEMNADMWKGQNGNMNIDLHMPQESEYSACSEAWAGQTGPQSRNERVRSEHLPDYSEIKHSSDKSPAKDAAETPQRSLREKTPESSKTSVPETKTTNESSNVRLCRNYLSKLDISLDLVKPELYEECMTMLAMKDKASVHTNVSMKEKSQNNKKDPIVAGPSTSHILSSLFTSRTDAVFQRAMSLYKKYNSVVTAMSSLSPSSCTKEKSFAELPDTEKPRGVDKQTISADTLLAEKAKEADNHASSDASLAAADSTISMGEGKAMAIDPEGSHPCDAKENQTDSFSDAVHFVEGSQPCEAILADCRVNLSRIHLSPGSTH